MNTKTKIHFAPHYFQNPSHKLSVLLIGAGGTGSQVLTCLARMNTTLIALGHPGLEVEVIDDDVVSEANIGRQMFSPTDIGRPKGQVLIERINRFFGLNWIAHWYQFHERNTATANIIISCVDNMKTRLNIQKIFKKVQNGPNQRKRKCYWMDFGNGNDSGQVVLGSKKIDLCNVGDFVHVKQLPTVFDLYPAFKKQKEDNSTPSCSIAQSIKKQDLFVNSTLAQLGCNILWKLIKEGSIDIQGCFMNLKTMNIKPIKIK